MIIFDIFFLLIFSKCSTAFSMNFTFAVMNDIHINPLYDPSVSVANSCSRSVAFNSFLSPINMNQNFSSFGRLGCDPPYKFLRLMLQKLKTSSEILPDFILLPGDFVSHGLSQSQNANYSDIKYELLKETLKRTYQQIKAQFTNTYLFPSLGNNDFQYHYQVPLASEKKKFYTSLFEEWFEKHTGNALLRNFAEIKTDFLNGGYYKADLNDNFSVIVLNTLYYSKSNNEDNDQESGEEQIIWLERKLEDIRKKLGKVIISYHIFPGLNYYKGIQVFINKTINERLQNIFNKYKDVIILNVASHIHMNGFRISHLESNEIDNEDDLFANTIISSSLSPVFYNNPSFLKIEIENLLPKRAKYTYFNMKEILNLSNHEDFTIEEINSYFFDYDLNKEYDLVDIGSKSIQNFAKRLFDDDAALRKFLVLSYGYPFTEENRNFVFGLYMKYGLFKDNINWEFDELEKRKYVCILMEMNAEGLKKCVGT